MTISTKAGKIGKFAAAALLTGAALSGLAGCVGTDASAPARNAAQAPVAHRPNVLVILVDDLDWADVSTYGRNDVPTPNIDRIARTGVGFSDGYVAASVCAVSRAGLLTGKMPQTFGFTYNINDEGDEGAGLPLDQLTLAERLKPMGYRTGAFGKWHLGADRQFYPTNRGFDEFYGFLAGETVFVDPRTPGIVTTPTKADKYPLTERKRNGITVEGPGARPVNDFDKYMTDEITRRAVEFVDRSAAKPGQPFFGYVAYNAPHWPLQVPQKWYDRFAHIKDPVRRTYVAMIAAMDDGVGQILDRLEATGQRDNTIVVFLSDNGCPVQFGFCNPAHPFGTGKFTYIEGGVRVPFAMSWPRGLRPAGIVDTPVSAIDIVPTVLHAAAPRSVLPQDLHGVDLVQTVVSPPKEPRTLVWGQEPVYAARRGSMKVWISQDRKQSYLYDLSKDPAELTDLSSRDAASKASLAAAIESWRSGLPKPLWKLHMTRTGTFFEGRETQIVY
ncbi:MAG: sulfatase [Novosphingobium sp.]|uniref:sulfatase family protein n=1 Tax=Novosphingobium sp. TaxID=1874826 RepID=UPI003B9CA13C